MEVHDDHLPMDAPDQEWIDLVGRKGWIAITKDKHIRYRYAEFAAVKTYRARVVVIRAKNLTGGELTELIIKCYLKIQNHSSNNPAPFVADLDRSGKLSNYEL